MSPRHPASNLILWLLPLALLVFFGAAMIADAGGAAAGFGRLLSQIFQRIHSVDGVTTPAGDPVSASSLQPGAWLDNATVLWPALLFLLLAGTLLLMMLARGWTFFAGLFLAAASATALGIAWLMYMRAHVLVDMLSPTVVLLLAYAAAPLLRGIETSFRRQQPRRMASAPLIVSPAAELEPVPEAEPEPPPPPLVEPANRTITCLVCRVRGYAHPNRPLDPADTLTLISGVLGPLAEAITYHRGGVLYASGTQLAGVWNAHGNDEEHAIHGCEAALRMQHALTQMKMQHGEGTPYDFVEVAVGLASGTSVTGSGAARDSTVVAGETLELADRLSRLALRDGPAILASEATRNDAERSFALLEADVIAVENTRMTVYALLGNPLVRASPKFRALSTFHTHLFAALRGQRWADARTLIDQCSNLSGAIPQLYELHLRRIAWYESHPPPPDWDGAFRPPIT
ncbi:MAG: adenylate/guanylate cyclase domain-containing protein [Alphaproteobacteria bacterium]|nr:adenylate/guanylate cyclase domain-containing protein [Alphaproteobacteria bacterium]MBV9063946.1 adenylate/guanylate cyclase domain-containing protein [Alphaproteobacteria bacterium]